MNKNDYILVTGTANIPLAKAIAKHLKKPVFEAVSQFADGEERVRIPENLRQRDVFIIQPTSADVDSHIMEILFMIDAARRASAKQITAVIPYFGYSRQDRKEQARVPISASLVANLIEFSGANRIVTVDIHSDQEQGFIRSPWDNLYSTYSLIPVLKKVFNGKNLVVASPDKGGVPRATFFAEKLGASGIAIVYKDRDIKKENQSKAFAMVGSVKGKDVLLVDDMIDTAGTICNAADLIIENGARSVSAAAAHGVFSAFALNKLSECALKQIFITDTIQATAEVVKHKKIRIVSVANLLAEAITYIFNGDSLSTKLIK